MPGIAGIIGLKDEEAAREGVAAMLSALRHETSYVHGLIQDAGQSVCAGWVAHPSSFSASGSGPHRERGLSVAFCGEVYDDDLVGATPTRLLDSLVPPQSSFTRERARKLNGQFSGLVINSSKREVFLFCDRFPMERLYVYQKGEVTYFASEAKALLLILPELRAFHPKGVAQFLTFGSTFEGQTLFNGIDRLPGAALWHFREGRIVSRATYFEPAEWEAQPMLTEEGFERAFASLFASAATRYLAGEGKLGVSITGGLDTRMVMACLPRLDTPPVCYTYAGISTDTRDVQLGRRVAKACGLEHEVIRIREDFLDDFASLLDRTVYITDGAAGALGAHEIYLSRRARQHSMVRLTGNYGSEILRSMSTLKPLVHPVGFLSVSRDALLEAAQRPAPPPHALTLSAFCEIPWHLYGTLAAARSQLVVRTPYLDNDVVKLAFRAPVASRRSVEPALRLIRENNRALAELPTDRGVRDGDIKALALLRKSASALSFKLDYLDKEALPGRMRALDPVLSAMARAGILGKHKFLPYRRWFREDLRSVVRDAFARAKNVALPWVDTRFLDTISSEHVTGRRNHLHSIDKVLTLETVNRLFIDGEAFGAVQQPKGDLPPQIRHG